ncbi:MAG: N-acetyl sugar amidotransferase [Gammaproteobacteria bacterium]|nr:N-acetyl sugar amidotransferase [Gammaproteobacteria bacterium]|tara:strand:- start:2510 stop:3778 length:1269 start_codon:yes stop_codon:yes gene_type:complete
MKYCLRCCYPENAKPAIIFDEEGICSGCRTFENRIEEKIDWDEKLNELIELVKPYKEESEKNDSPYDCIIPISGGKDSHYQAHIVTKILKMKPLFVTYNHSYNTKIGIQNLTNMVEKFGCDLLRYTTNPITARKISRYMLKKVGDITWHYHAGIMTFPIRTAVNYKIPLILWGEHGHAYLYGMYNLDDKVEFTKKHRQEHLMRGFEPDDILDDPENKDITKTDLAPFYYPSDEEIESLGVRGIYIGNNVPWDQHQNTKLAMEKYGFQTLQKRETTFNLYGKIEDFFQDTHNYLKYLKFGYSRATDHVSVEIRHQRITREEGIEMIKKYEYLVRPSNLDKFLEFAQISEQEFLDSINHLRDSSIWRKTSDGKWELLDWIGNHKDDPGVKEARLPVKNKLEIIKSKQNSLSRESKNDENDLVIL